MSRSIWKGPFSSKQFAFNRLAQKKRNTAVWSRGSMIVPSDIGKELKIYNGNSWTLRKIAEEMVGHKLGEFCPTKRKTIHKLNKTRQLSRKK